MRKKPLLLFVLTFGAFAASTAFGVLCSADSGAPGDASADQTAEEKVGVRPYEMDWAGRTEEVRPALVDFENLDGWTVETNGAVASLERSREEQMYGKYVGKLTYRVAVGENGKPATGSPVVDVRPPEPIAIPDVDFDAVSCWINGNNWGYAPDPKTPQVRVSALFKAKDGTDAAVGLHTVDWREWFLCYSVVPKAARDLLKDGAVFTGFRVEGGTNVEDRTIYLDSFCAFKEEKKPLDIPLRPKPGIDLFPGQPLGINSGEGRLPFPTRPETILPDSAQNLRTPMFHSYGDSFDFVYDGYDGTLVYYYRPQNGDWSDVTATWNGSKPFKPLAGGGVVNLIGKDGPIEPVEKRELLSCEAKDSVVVSRWRLSSATGTADVEYRFQLMGKSLVVDTIALGGNVYSVEFGRVEGIENPRTFSIPYYLYDYWKRPGTLIFSIPPKNPNSPSAKTETLFASGHIDWYRSGASYLFGTHGAGVDSAVINGAARYEAKTDQTRNDVYERFFFTVSPVFEETLPTIANPKSPYKHIAGKGVWRAHGATTRDGDKKYWRDVWRRGMRHMIVTDHEVCWRDGGESFTFRTKPAPKKGGDEGWFDYCRFMQDELGFVYGPYNNFTDFAPVNEYWSPDMINRLPDNSLQRAWMRCYAPKPTRAVEYCEKLTPINEEKFHFSCAYCDVHSSVPPWTRTDYDARVPGAGMLMSVFYPYGEIFLLQKKNWDGPTYSEGPHHCFYAGLVDGNYAQDQPYNLRVNPWLVDFDMRKLRELETDFGLGNVEMFAPGYKPKDDAERVALLDRFITGTIAFGHPGFFAADTMNNGAKSYFAVQQIASRYTQCSAKNIRYFDETGTPLDTSAALIADVVKRNQLAVEYEDGTIVVANGNEKETLETTFGGRDVELPPNGYVAWTADGAILTESRLSDAGTKYDYCESPEYIYVDGRGSWVELPRACGSGAGVCRIVSADEFESIPYDGAELGFKIASDAESVEATALAYDLSELGPAKVRRSRGYVFVEPVEGAFSYKLTKKPASDAVQNWTSDRFEVAAGETVKATGPNGASVDLAIPADAAPGRLWLDAPNGGSIDFLVVEPFAVDFSFDAKANVLTGVFKTRLPGETRIETTFESTALSEPTTLATGLKRGVPSELACAFLAPKSEGEETATATIRAKTATGAETTRVVELKFSTKSAFVRFDEFDFGSETGEFSPTVKATSYMQNRSDAPRPFSAHDPTGAQTYFAKDIPSGGVSKSGWFTHPMYLEGTFGRTFWRFDFDVPSEPTTFRLEVGKRDGSDVGDGIRFQIAVAKFDADGVLIPDSETKLAETILAEHVWRPFEADLSAYAGERISLLLISDPNGNTNGDHGATSNVRLESTKTALIRSLID